MRLDLALRWYVCVAEGSRLPRRSRPVLTGPRTDGRSRHALGLVSAVADAAA